MRAVYRVLPGTTRAKLGSSVPMAATQGVQDGSPEQLEKSRRHIRLVRAATDYNKQVVERHGIHCDRSRCGEYHAAVTPASHGPDSLAPG